MTIRQVGHANLILETLPRVCRHIDWKLKTDPKHLWGRNEWEEIRCKVETDRFTSTFNLQQMPGCCAVLIASYIHPDPFKEENFADIIRVIESAAYDAGFGSILMAQVIRHDELWPVVLKQGWEISEKFVNAKSGNKVVYLTRNLNQPGKRYGFEQII